MTDTKQEVQRAPAARPTLIGMLVETLAFVDATMQCACSPPDRYSGHLTDCWVPAVRERIEAALNVAGDALKAPEKKS